MRICSAALMCVHGCLLFILLPGHTLGTGLFSPPPSTGNQHGGMFINSPISSRKVGYSPNHPPPVGSGKEGEGCDDDGRQWYFMGTKLPARTLQKAALCFLAGSHAERYPLY